MTALERIARHLDKPTPDHVWLLGPAPARAALFAGLAARTRKAGGHHRAVAEADVGDGTPVAEALARAGLAALGEGEGEGGREALEDALGTNRRRRLLALIDGVATSEGWGRVRALAERAPITIVAGGEQTLRVLDRRGRGPASQAGALFYDTPVRVA